MYLNAKCYAFFCGVVVSFCLLLLGCKPPADYDAELEAETKQFEAKVEELKSNPQKEAELRKKAENGDIEAQIFLGKYYYKCYHDYSENLDYYKSEYIKWLKRAAEAGSAKAQIELHNRYYSLEGSCEHNFVEATRWLDMALKQNSTEAMYKLGCDYGSLGGSMSGTSNFVVRHDYSKMIDWYRKAAERGHVEAQYELGYFYHMGCIYRNFNLTWKERYSEVEKWYRLASSNGYKKAEEGLKKLRELDEVRSQLLKDKAFVAKLKEAYSSNKVCFKDEIRYNDCLDTSSIKGFTSESNFGYLHVQDFASELDLKDKKEYTSSFSDLIFENSAEYLKHLEKVACAGEYGQEGSSRAQKTLGDIYSGLFCYGLKFASEDIESMSWDERLFKAIKWYRMALDNDGRNEDSYASKRIKKLEFMMNLLSHKEKDQLTPEEKYCLGIGYLSYLDGFFTYDPEKAYMWLNVAAQDGYFKAQCALGDLYLSAHFINDNLNDRINRAENLYKMGLSAENNEDDRSLANHKLKRLNKIKNLLLKKKNGTLTADEKYILSEEGSYFGGLVTKNEAIQLREGSIRGGSTMALNHLITVGDRLHGHAVCTGYGSAESEECYYKAAKYGNDEIKERLKDKLPKETADIEVSEQGIDKEKRRLSLCEKSLSGDTSAMNSLWYNCVNERMTASKLLQSKLSTLSSLNKTDEREYKKLEVQLLKGAERGDAEAQYKLGCLYYLWWTFLNEDPLSKYNLSMYDFDCYGYKGVKDTYGRDSGDEYLWAAEKWWSESVKQGYADAQFCLGMCYVVRPSLRNFYNLFDLDNGGVNLLYRAACQGETYAQSVICRMVLVDYYHDSHNCDVSLKDDEKTKFFQFCQKAAEKGDANAQDQLSIMYLYGFGTSENLSEAKKWSQKAIGHKGYYPYSAYLYGLHKLGLDKY